MKITESQLRNIIRDEARRLVEGPDDRKLVVGAGNPSWSQSYVPGASSSFSYAKKLEMLRAALDELVNAQVYETQSGTGEDPDLDGIIESLEGYITAVEALDEG